MTDSLKKYVANLISRREYTKQEVTKKLRQRFAEASLEDINGVVDRFEELGIISDERFTEMYVRYGLNKNWGQSRIARQLAQKGVSRDSIDKYFLENSLKIDKKNLAETVKQKYKFSAFSNLPSDEKNKVRQKIERYLLYRGHSFSDVKLVFERLG
jgi:regulatory protein